MKKITLILAYLSLALFGSAQKRISQLPEATSISSDDVFPIVQDGATKKIPYSKLKKANPHCTSVGFAVYQSGTSSPNATVLFNEFADVEFSWQYVSVGVYTITASSPVFASDKTFVNFGVEPFENTHFAASRQSTTIVRLATLEEANNANGLLGNTPGSPSLIIIEVYP